MTWLIMHDANLESCIPYLHERSAFIEFQTIVDDKRLAEVDDEKPKQLF